MSNDITNPLEDDQQAVSQSDTAMKTYLQFLAREIVKKLKEKQDKLKAATTRRSQT